MRRCTILLALSAVVAAGAVPAEGASRHARHHRKAPQAARRAVPPYGVAVDPRPTCYTANGTPYDPDITGGINHVGDGGPGVNLGTGLGDPCGPAYLGGPGVFGGR